MKTKFEIWFWPSALMLLSGALPLYVQSVGSVLGLDLPSASTKAGIAFGIGMLTVSLIFIPVWGAFVLLINDAKPRTDE